MRLTVNGALEEHPDGRTVAELVQARTGTCPDAAHGTAVARGGEVVPRTRWASTALADGDVLELLTATAGG